MSDFVSLIGLCTYTDTSTIKMSVLADIISALDKTVCLSIGQSCFVPDAQVKVTAWPALLMMDGDIVEYIDPTMSRDIYWMTALSSTVPQSCQSIQILL